MVICGLSVSSKTNIAFESIDFMNLTSIVRGALNVYTKSDTVLAREDKCILQDK